MVTKEGQRITVLWLCEQKHLILKPHNLYMFEIDKNCKQCRELAEACQPTTRKN